MGLKPVAPSTAGHEGNGELDGVLHLLEDNLSK